MHSEDGDEDTQSLSNFYGLWPGVLGVLFGLGVIWFMFTFADGFA